VLLALLGGGIVSFDAASVAAQPQSVSPVVRPEPSTELAAPTVEELEIHRNLAFALVTESEYAAAWPHVAILLEAGEDAWWLHLAAAQICLYWRRDNACVESHAERALELRPDSARAYTLLGQMAQELGEVDRAIEYYRQSLAIRSSETEVSIRLADLLDRSGQRSEAIGIMAQALQQSPRDARLMIRLATLIEDTDPDYAESLLTLAVSYHDEPALAYGHLLRFYERHGLDDRAEEVREVLDELVGRRRLRAIR